MGPLLLFAMPMPVETIAVGVVTSDDIGMIAGWIPPMEIPIEPLIVAASSTNPMVRSLALDGLARALLGRGRAPDAFRERLCAECGSDAPTQLARIAPMLESDANVMLALPGLDPRALQQMTQPETLPQDTSTRSAVLRFNTGYLLAQSGDFATAEPLQRAALVTFRAALGRGDSRVAAAQLGLVRTLIGLNKLMEATALLAELANLPLDDLRLHANMLTLQARVAHRRGDAAAAATALEKAIAFGDQDRQRRAARIVPAAALNALVAKLTGEAVPDTERYTIVGDSMRGPLAEIDGQRRGMFARLLLQRGETETAEAMARASLAMAPSNTDGALTLAAIELSGGALSDDRIVEIENTLDYAGWGPGRTDSTVIEGRAGLARLLRERDPARAWIQARQGGAAAREWLQTAARTDLPGGSRAVAGVLGEQVHTAWDASTMPTPVWPADQRKFVIYFDVDSSDAGSAGDLVLDAAVDAWRRLGGRVIVSGHLDLYGTREYLIGLSGRLADGAREGLLARGVPAERIATISYGKERPIADGRPGLPDRLQRRAEILIESER